MLNRRLMMAQKKAGPPPGEGIVTDGLVFHLDGLNRGGIPGHWIDSISNHDFTLHNVKEDNTGVEFTGDGSYGEDVNGTAFAHKTHTIQVVWKSASADIRRGVLYSPSNILGTDAFTFGVQASNLIFSCYDEIGYNFEYRHFPDHNYTVSANYGVGYINSQKQESSSFFWGFAPRSTSAFLGCRNKGEWFPAKIYSIRIYNRILTDAEILQNQQYDIDTYFGGVIPE